MKELQGNNGAHIIINAAPFGVVKQLRQCVAEQLKAISIDIGNPETLNELKGAFNNNVSRYLNDFKNLILGLETSNRFQEVMWQCLSHCVYDNKQIKESLFDDIEQARNDYDLIVYECIKENLAPFFSNLIGKLSILENSKEEVQQ